MGRTKTALLALLPAVVRIREVKSKAPNNLDALIAYAKGYAEFAMRKVGRVTPTMLAVTSDGLLHFLPESMADERAKNEFANIGRLICSAYGATSVVMIVESWVTMAKLGQGEDARRLPDQPLRRKGLTQSHTGSGEPLLPLARSLSRPRHPF